MAANFAKIKRKSKRREKRKRPGKPWKRISKSKSGLNLQLPYALSIYRSKLPMKLVLDQDRV